MEPAQHHEAVDGLDVFWREAPSADPAAATPLYLHGVPADADVWLPLLERTGGIAPDLPGFGRSDKPADFDYSIAGYARWVERFLDARGIDRVRLAVHDWGAVGLAFAQRAPERIERLLVVDAVPFLPGYRWHRFARIWRTPLAGELAMGFTTRRLLRRGLREAFAADREAADALAARAWTRFDHGTQRAILKLYRSAPPEELARAGERLGEIACPALVVWGEDDPFLPTRFAHDYAQALGGGESVRTEIVEGAGHWPWLERPQLAGRMAAFVANSGEQ